MNFELFLEQELYRAYLEARKGKRKTFDEHIFELNAYENINLLKNSILTRTYSPSRSEAFIIHDPVMREIFAAPFRDRIVHHFIYSQVANWWDRHFIADSYSCRIGRGTLYGQKRFEKHARSLSQNFKYPIFVAKLDISGYFMSLERKKLYERAIWGLDKQFQNQKFELYHTIRFLWQQVIFDGPIKGVKIRGRKTDWNGLPDNKSLFHQPPGHGIVIGNLTSQLLSNIYLDQLDRFITFNLNYKHYGRYVDDFYILVRSEEKEKLLKDIPKIDFFLKSIGLTLHPKKRIFTELKYGVDFLGATMYPGYIVPGKRIKKNATSAFRDFASNGQNLESVISYLGHLEHINSKKFLAELFDSLGWD